MINTWLTSCKHAPLQFSDKIPNPLIFMWEVIPWSTVSIIPPIQLKYLSFSLKLRNSLQTYILIIYMIYLLGIYTGICTHTSTNTHVSIFPSNTLRNYWNVCCLFTFKIMKQNTVKKINKLYLLGKSNPGKKYEWERHLSWLLDQSLSKLRLL